MMNHTSVFMFLTRSCNLACSHCYVSAEPQLQGRMEMDVFHRIIDSLSAQGVDDIRLTGGEPTIHPDFESMLDLLNSKLITPRLITNGIRLMSMGSPQAVLDKVSQCWVSTYGISPQGHRAVGGKRSRPLEEILEFAGRQARAGYWVGVSALLTDASTDTLSDFVALAKKYGVRYLRFLFAEPSGRAASTNVVFAHGDRARDQALTIIDYLRHAGDSSDFDFLSINNPFDLDSAHERGQTSCMLSSRRMWSISPEGDVYSCCFNIYDPEHLLANALSGDCLDTISNEDMAKVYAPRCKALGANFWGTSKSTITCPISALTLSRSK